MEKRIMEHTFFDDLFREKINIIDLGACKGEFSFHLNEMYDVDKIVVILKLWVHMIFKLINDV